MKSWMLGLCFVLAAAPAHADDKAKAKALYDEGLRHFNVAEYTQAIDAWKESYLLSKKPLLLFNIGQAYRLSGDCTQAMTFYDNYTNAEPNPKNQDELDQAVAACKDKVTATVTPPPADTKPAEPKPVEPAPVEAKPVAPPVAPTPPAPAPAASGHRTLGIGITIAGGLLEAGAVYFALDGRSKASDVEKVTDWNQSAKDTQSAGQLDNKLAIGLAIGGGAALVAGVVLIVTGGHSAESGVAIVPAPDGARVGYTAHF